MDSHVKRAEAEETCGSVWAEQSVYVCVYVRVCVCVCLCVPVF